MSRPYRLQILEMKDYVVQRELQVHHCLDVLPRRPLWVHGRHQYYLVPVCLIQESEEARLSYHGALQYPGDILCGIMCEQVNSRSPGSGYYEMYPGHRVIATFAIQSFPLLIHKRFLQRIAMVRGVIDASARVTFHLLQTSAGFVLPGT